MIYEMPWVLNAVWKLIKQLLTDEQQKFVIFAKKNDVDKYIPRDQLLVHMGGTVSNNHHRRLSPAQDSLTVQDRGLQHQLFHLISHMTIKNHNCILRKILVMVVFGDSCSTEVVH